MPWYHEQDVNPILTLSSTENCPKLHCYRVEALFCLEFSGGEVKNLKIPEEGFKNIWSQPPFFVFFLEWPNVNTVMRLHPNDMGLKILPTHLEVYLRYFLLPKRGFL